ncbi:MAG: restriction endonuclease subunit S, partial [Halanaerobiales bacterium]
ELPSRAKRIFNKDDILMSTVRPYLKGFALVNFYCKDCLASTGFAILKCKRKEDIHLLYYNLFSYNIEKQINRLLVGSNYPAINIKDVGNLKIPYSANKMETKSIGKILATWDKSIQLKEKLIEQKKQQQKGLMQNLLTGKVRLPGFTDKWKELRLGSLIKSKTEKTTINNQHRILSCTKDGLILQEEHFKKQIASSNNVGYKIIKKNELVFSPMNLWLGGIDISDFDVGIVSPAYKVYKIDYEKINKNFIKVLLKSDYMIQRYKAISKRGASVVRRNLSVDDFEALKIKVPNNSEEINLIGSILYQSSKEINLLEKELELIKQQKKGLMQLLLTGIVRVTDLIEGGE